MPLKVKSWVIEANRLKGPTHLPLWVLAKLSVGAAHTPFGIESIAGGLPTSIFRYSEQALRND
jgi:hypothetical protein